jgi:hypothetical protein
MGGSFRASSSNLGFAGGPNGMTMHTNLKTLNHLQVNIKFVLLNKFKEHRQQKNEKKVQELIELEENEHLAKDAIKNKGLL